MYLDRPPSLTNGAEYAREHYEVQKSASHIAIMTDEYYKKLNSFSKIIIINSH